jgi:hypothetical protein
MPPGGKRLALSIGAGLALPAYAGLLTLLPLEAFPYLLAAFGIVGCALIGLYTYRALGD